MVGTCVLGCVGVGREREGKKERENTEKRIREKQDNLYQHILASGIK